MLFLSWSDQHAISTLFRFFFLLSTKKNYLEEEEEEKEEEETQNLLEKFPLIYSRFVHVEDLKIKKKNEKPEREEKNLRISLRKSSSRSLSFRMRFVLSFF